MPSDNPGTTTPQLSRRQGPITRLRRNMWFSAVFNLLVAIVVIALVQTFVVRLYVIPSSSMSSTLNVGDRILVNRLAYRGDVPSRGDVVVFSASADWTEATTAVADSKVKDLLRSVGDVTTIGPSHEKFLVKRVIGVPGDTVACCSAEGAVEVGGQALEEPYVHNNLPFDQAGQSCETASPSRRCFGPFTVPEGMLLVLGDNRGNSRDSVYACRGSVEDSGCLKLVPVERVIGRTFLTVFPLNRIAPVR